MFDGSMLKGAAYEVYLYVMMDSGKWVLIVSVLVQGGSPKAVVILFGTGVNLSLSQAPIQKQLQIAVPTWMAKFGMGSGEWVDSHFGKWPLAILLQKHKKKH